MKTVNYNFESINALGEHIAALQQPHRYYRDSEANYFSDTPHSLTDAVKIAINGGYWEQGAKDLQSVELNHDGRNCEGRRVMRPNVTGFMPNVPAMLAGEPLTMYDLPAAGEHRKLIKIGLGVSCSASVTASQLKNRGRAVLAVVDDLTAQGYAVEVLAYMGTGNEQGLMHITTTVKQAHEQWSPSSAAFMLANTSIYRRLGFRLLEATEGTDTDLTCVLRDAYGIPQRKDINECDIWIGSILYGETSAWDAPDTALKHVQEMAQEYLDKLAV